MKIKVCQNKNDLRDSIKIWLAFLPFKLSDTLISTPSLQPF